MSLRPREYQRRAIDAILARRAAGDRRTLCVCPTGGGKTVIAAHVGDRGWCTVSPDGDLIRCMRVASDRPSVGKDGQMGWLHPVPEHAPARPSPSAPKGKAPRLTSQPLRVCDNNGGGGRPDETVACRNG